MVEEGDIIEIDIPGRTINLAVQAQVLQTRLQHILAKGDQAWQPSAQRPRKVSTALKAYAALTTSADKGAVRDKELLK